jgi:hypothetical protein
MPARIPRRGCGMSFGSVVRRSRPSTGPFVIPANTVIVLDPGRTGPAVEPLNARTRVRVWTAVVGRSSTISMTRIGPVSVSRRGKLDAQSRIPCTPIAGRSPRASRCRRARAPGAERCEDFERAESLTRCQAHECRGLYGVPRSPGTTPQVPGLFMRRPGKGSVGFLATVSSPSCRV